MKKLLFVLLLTGCAGSLKFGSDGSATFTPDPATTKNIQTLAQGLTTLDASINAMAEAINKLNQRVTALEPKPAPAPAGKVISKNSVQ